MNAKIKDIWCVKYYQPNVWYIFKNDETRAQVMCQTEDFANNLCDLLNANKNDLTLSKNFSDISTEMMIDMVDANTVEISINSVGKLYVNVNGKCRLRINKIKKGFSIDDPVRGLVVFKDE